MIETTDPKLYNSAMYLLPGQPITGHTGPVYVPVPFLPGLAETTLGLLDPGALVWPVSGQGLCCDKEGPNFSGVLALWDGTPQPDHLPYPLSPYGVAVVFASRSSHAASHLIQFLEDGGMPAQVVRQIASGHASEAGVCVMTVDEETFTTLQQKTAEDEVTTPDSSTVH